MAAKTDHGPEKTVVAQLPRVEFDNIQLKTTVDDEPEVPTLTKAPDTSDLVSVIHVFASISAEEDRVYDICDGGVMNIFSI